MNNTDEIIDLIDKIQNDLMSLRNYLTSGGGESGLDASIGQSLDNLKSLMSNNPHLNNIPQQINLGNPNPNYNQNLSQTIVMPEPPYSLPTLDLTNQNINGQNLLELPQSEIPLELPASEIPLELPPSPVIEKKIDSPDVVQVDSSLTTISNSESVSGPYNGEHITTYDNSTYTVPPNFSARSKLVYGDILERKVKESGQGFYEILERVPTEVIKGTLTKTENNWFLLTDKGSFKLLNTAVDMQKGSQDDEATALIPLGNYQVSFATLDELINPKIKKGEANPVMRQKPQNNDNRGSNSSKSRKPGSGPKKSKDNDSVNEKDINLANYKVLEDDDLR